MTLRMHQIRFFRRAPFRTPLEELLTLLGTPSWLERDTHRGGYPLPISHPVDAHIGIWRLILGAYGALF